MDMIGELERSILPSLWPNRVPIAIALALLAVGLIVLAWRRRWDLAARRRPRRTAAIVGLFLAIALPAGWILASPLFIRTQLNEGVPGAAAGSVTEQEPADPLTVGPVEQTPGQPEPSADDQSSSSVDGQGSVLAAGAFQGADDFHFGRGRALLIEVEPGRQVLRFEDFAVQNGPDLFVYLSTDPDGYSEDGLELGRLRATDGNVNYDVPAGTDVSHFRSAVIWCRQFGVLFATATFGQSS